MDNNNGWPSVPNGGDWRLLLDIINWNPSVPNGGDWRTQLTPDFRQNIINKIMETLKKHLPRSGHAGIEELSGIAARFEEKVFSVAVNQNDYLRKISIKMLKMETKSQNAAGSSSSITAATNGTSMDSRHLMDNNNNRRPSLPNWRTQLPPDSRQKIIHKIMETLKKHLPRSRHAGIEELRGIAARFEEKVFSGAVNQSDYLRKISMKMLTIEKNSQNAAGSSSSITAATNGTSMDSRHLMDNNNNWRPSLPNGEATMDTCDWRTQLPPDTLQKIYNTLMDFSRTLNQITGSTALPSPMQLASSIPNNNVTSAAQLKRLKGYLSVKARMKARAKVPKARAKVPLEIGGVQLKEEYVDEDKKEMDMKKAKEERELDH